MATYLVLCCNACGAERSHREKAPAAGPWLHLSVLRADVQEIGKPPHELHLCPACIAELPEKLRCAVTGYTADDIWRAFGLA
jgi:hypothetical protein